MGQDNEKRKLIHPEPATAQSNSLVHLICFTCSSVTTVIGATNQSRYKERIDKFIECSALEANGEPYTSRRGTSTVSFWGSNATDSDEHSLS
jgi:hypothetical protein